MKEQDITLTLQETEQLCRLYMDCRLSVLEETELHYVLGKLPYSSPCIDEVRMLMGLTISHEAFKTKKRAFTFSGYKTVISIAASVAIVIGIGITFWKSSSQVPIESQSYYVAYVDEHRLSDEAARLQIETREKLADAFIEEMLELEVQQLQMIDNFYNP